MKYVAAEIEPLKIAMRVVRDAPAAEIEPLKIAMRVVRDAPAAEIEEDFLVWKLKKRKRNKQAFIL